MTTEELNSKWAECLKLIQSIIGDDSYQRWFAVAKPVGFDNGRLTLWLPSDFFAYVYENTFYELLSNTLRRVFGKAVRLEYAIEVVSNDKSTRVHRQSVERSHVINNKLTRQIEKDPMSAMSPNFDSQLNSMLTFENYCVGESNKLAVTIAEHIADHPEKPDFNPYFLYGSVGVGKTHLIQAIGIRIKERNPRARVLFNTMRQFQNLYVDSMRKNIIPDFINWYCSMDAILFDDLQELSGKSGTASVLFPIFNHLHQHNKKLVFTCDRPPMELDGIMDRLIDRFKWGITEPLPKPDLELRKKILHSKAERNGLDLSDDIINHIAEHAETSVRELEGIVMGLYTRAITLNCPITLDLAKEVVAHSVKTVVKKTVNFDMIVENTAEYFGLNPDAIFAKSRIRDIADARQIIMFLCSKHTGLSTPAIGAKINREHSTVLHGIKAVKDRIGTSKEVASAIESIEKALLR